MPDIFLSYSRDDLVIARRFAEAFERQGFSVWWDQALTPGEAFDEVTEKALNEARAVVVLWSKKSVASRWVRAEATQASDNRTLFPVMIEPCKRPIMFELTHTADLSAWKGDTGDPAWLALVANVRRVMEAGAPTSTSRASSAAPIAAHSVGRTWRPAISMAVAALLLGPAIWWFAAHRSDAPASVGVPATPATAIPQAAAIISPASIAVMPFANLTGDAAKEYFSDGMAEELINLLSKVQGLKVASRPSSFAYKDRGTDVREMARILGVKTVLEGSVRSAGETIRITAQLIDAESGYNLWSETYDRQYEDLFKLQDELARQIVTAFRMTMGADLQDYSTQKPPTDNLEAYSLYLRAVAAHRKGTQQSLNEALALLDQALVLDPQFARALSQRAFTAYLAFKPLDEVESNARRAVELDPSVGAQGALSYVALARGQWLESAKWFEEAVAQNRYEHPAPFVFTSSGLLHKSVEVNMARQRADPGDSGPVYGLTMNYAAMGRNADALRHADLAAVLGMDPKAGDLPLARAVIAARGGHFDDLARLQTSRLNPRALEAGGAQVVALVYEAMADPARRNAAVATVGEFVKGLDRAEDRRVAGMAIEWLSQLGAVGEAYALAERLARQPSVRPDWGTLWKPEMRAFRQDSRFGPFVERLGMLPLWEQYGPPIDCKLSGGKLVCP